MPILHGYSGLYTSPLCNMQDIPTKSSYTPRRSAIYCAVSESMRELIMVPLAPNFFETAYAIGKNTPYQKIYLAMPSPDVLYVTDVYLLYQHLHHVLGKDVEILCASEDTPSHVSDDFYAHVHSIGHERQFQITDYPDSAMDAEHCNFSVSFPSFGYGASMNREVSDVCLSIGEKRILFCQYMTDEKLDFLASDEQLRLFDEIHIPFVKTLYGGLPFIKARLLATTPLLLKLYTFGVRNDEELQLLRYYGNKGGRVIYNDLV